MLPELLTNCITWFPEPANVVVILEAAIVHNSDLVGVGWSEPRADRQLLWRVRLSRRAWMGWHSSWAAGYSAKDGRNTTLLEGRFRSESTIKHAEDLLGQITELFADAKGVSNRYKNCTAPQDDSLVVYSPHTDLDPATAKLHKKMRKLAIERQNRSGLRQKTRWALYQKNQFRHLVDDITELVDSLVRLFPATQQTPRDLCDSEVSANYRRN
jgi:hypothetical protein